MVQCPLCGGPVEVAGDGLDWELGHRAHGDALVASEHELAAALWMAVQALDNEADVLRALSGREGRQFADDAERQARLLREFARDHTSRIDAEGVRDRADEGPSEPQAP